MQPNKKLSNLQQAFLSNPTLDVLYVTADGMPFKTAEHAAAQAVNLVKKVTPNPMPADGTPQAVSAKALMTAAGVVTPVKRDSVGSLEAADGGEQAAGAAGQSAGAGGGEQAAAPAPVVMTKDQAAAANDAAQAALKTAQDGVTAAEGVLARATTDLGEATAANKAKLQKVVNSATGALEQAKVVLENAQVDALLAQQTLENVPAA